MNVLEADREKGFSFIWTIQNYNFCFRKNKDISYESPAFMLNDKSDEKWCLNMYPERYFSHDSIGIALKKCTGTKVTTANTSSLFGSTASFQGVSSGQRPVWRRPASIIGVSQKSNSTGTKVTTADTSLFGSAALSQGFSSGQPQVCPASISGVSQQSNNTGFKFTLTTADISLFGSSTPSQGFSSGQPHVSPTPILGLSQQSNSTGSEVTTADTTLFGSTAPSQGFSSAQPQVCPAPILGVSQQSNSTGSKVTTSFTSLFRSVASSQGFSPGQPQVCPRPASTVGVLQQLNQTQPTNQPAITHEIMLEVSICEVRGSFEKKLRNKLMFRFNPDNPDKSDNLKLKINKEELPSYLKNDSITILCKMLDMKNPILTTRQCYARTIIGVERITYPCTVEGFTDLENGGNIEKKFHIFSEVTSFSMNFFSTRETYAENKFQITIQLTEPKAQCYSICEISLVDADGGIAHFVREEHDFDVNNLGQAWTFPFIEVRKILSNKELFLSNGVLRLRCEFGFSPGVTYNKVERTEFGTENSRQLQCSGQITDSDFPESLKKNLQRFYEEGKFSDVTIRTPSKEFRVHKPILCARSEVFTAMFERDLKENQTGVVDIEDIDDDTISKMLLFLYTDTVGEDLEFETASSLYFAADKYRIVALKRKCADFLKSTFTVSNVCDLLVLADMHQDEKLKSAAQKFIFEHSKPIIDSVEWKKFMEEKVHLASGLMYTMLKRI